MGTVWGTLCPPIPWVPPQFPVFSPFPGAGTAGMGTRGSRKSGGQRLAPPERAAGGTGLASAPCLCVPCVPPSGAPPSAAPSPRRGDGIRTSPNAPANGVFARPGPYRPALISGHGPPRADPPDGVTSVSPSTRGAPPALPNTLRGHPGRDHSRFPAPRHGVGAGASLGGVRPQGQRGQGGSLGLGCTPGVWNPPSLGFPLSPGDSRCFRASVSPAVTREADG